MGTGGTGREIHLSGRSELVRRCCLALAVLLLVAGGIAAWFEYLVHEPQGDVAAPFAVRAAPGESYDLVANQLARRGLISSTGLFDIDARLHRLGTELQAGIYFLRPNMSIDDMVKALGAKDPLISFSPANFASGDPHGRILARVTATLNAIPRTIPVTRRTFHEPQWITLGCDGSYGWGRVEADETLVWIGRRHTLEMTLNHGLKSRGWHQLTAEPGHWARRGDLAELDRLSRTSWRLRVEAASLGPAPYGC